jgi:hypothetical protein
MWQCTDAPIDTTYLLLYVGDIVLTASSPKLLQRTTTTLQQQFTMKGISLLQYFFGVSVEQRPNTTCFFTSANTLGLSLSALA